MGAERLSLDEAVRELARRFFLAGAGKLEHEHYVRIALLVRAFVNAIFNLKFLFNSAGMRKRIPQSSAAITRSQKMMIVPSLRILALRSGAST